MRQDILLPLRSRNRESNRVTIIVNGAPENDRMDVIPILDGRLIRLEQQQSRTLAGNHSVGIRVEDAADPLSREDISLAEADVDLTIGQELDSTYDGCLAITGPQPRARLVDPHQGGRAGGVHHLGGTLEVKEVGDTRRGHVRNGVDHGSSHHAGGQL